MYDEEFGTDWEELDEQETYRRAFALGVSTSLGNDHPGELDRILDEATSVYHEGIIELAFEEGKNRGQKRDAEDAETDSEAVWESEIDDWVDELVEIQAPDSLPPALDRLGALDPPGDGLDRVRLPRFLLRR